MSNLPDISIMDWIKYNPNIGTMALFQFGLPGSGKSNFQSGLFQMCLKRGEFLIMPGDRFCEWRHFPRHPKFPTKLKILVPKLPEGEKIHYHNFKRNGWFVDVDYEYLDIFDYINDKKRMLVIYDQHLPLAERTYLWVNIFKSLLNRTEYIDIPFGLFFHEAGIYFDEFAEGDHWKAIKEFSSLFVEHRKALIRPAFISQLESEVKSTIRKKCTFQIIRKAFLSKNYPKSLRKAAPFTPVFRYHLLYGGIYIKNNECNKYYEEKNIFKMIPPHVSFNEKGGAITATTAAKFPQICPKCHGKWNARTPKPLRCPKYGCGAYLSYKTEVKHIETV